MLTTNKKLEYIMEKNGVVIESGAIVRDSVIMSGVTIKAGAVVNYAIIDSNTVQCH